MHHAIYEELKRVAAAKTLTTYGEVAPLAELDMSSPRDISRFEHEQGRHLLSAVVVLQEQRRPGKGFFSLARSLDLYNGHDELAELTFWSEEVKRVHAVWKRMAT